MAIPKFCEALNLGAGLPPFVVFCAFGANAFVPAAVLALGLLFGLGVEFWLAQPVPIRAAMLPALKALAQRRPRTNLGVNVIFIIV